MMGLGQMVSPHRQQARPEASSRRPRYPDRRNINGSSFVAIAALAVFTVGILLVSTVIRTRKYGENPDRPQRLEPVEGEAAAAGDRTSDTGAPLTKRYPSFSEYVVESRGTDEPLPVPVVTPQGQNYSLSLPLLTIIGVQKSGTTSLRKHLITHPLVSGLRGEVMFFSRDPLQYPALGRWPGDDANAELRAEDAGQILEKYAEALLDSYRRRDERSQEHPDELLLIDSRPRYIVYPPTPFRMHMVLPKAKFVVVLRDPTDRYFSHLRMIMCDGPSRKRLFSRERYIERFFHPPRWAEEYVAEAAKKYRPYTAICRGEHAEEEDLIKCAGQLEPHNPVQRGLYADQLERWFRLYDRSQMMILDSADLFRDFVGTVKAVAAFAGLPSFDFEYVPGYKFSGNCSRTTRDLGTKAFFAEGGLYERMLEAEGVFREFYRPHNERLFQLLGRDLGWNG